MKIKTILSIFLAGYLCVIQTSLGFADDVIPNERIQTIHNKIQAECFGYKKTKHYTAVEIGFTNLMDQYVEFTPKEIYLDDEKKYSLSLLSIDQVRAIEQAKPGASILPTALGVGLGIAALATSRYNKDVAWGLGMGALSVGGAALLTKGLENRAKQNKLITFENNTIASIKKLPPGMTLGGVLYFPPTKKPKSITIIAKSSSGKMEKKVFPLTKAKKH